MKYCWHDKKEHCCKRMADFLEDARIPIDFIPERNYYFLTFVWPYTTKQGLTYCPWCGTKLPEVIYKDLE